MIEPLIAEFAQRGARIVTATFHLDDARWRTVRADAAANVRLVEPAAALLVAGASL